MPRVDFWAGRLRPPLGRSPSTNGEAFGEVINFPDFSCAFGTQFTTFPSFCAPLGRNLQLFQFLVCLWGTLNNFSDFSRDFGTKFTTLLINTHITSYWGGRGSICFLQISFCLVEISLDFEFQPSRVLRTQITYVNPI